MAVTSEGYQPTPLTQPVSSAGASPTTAPAEAPAAPEPDPFRVGVVFVHGIGTQKPSETFLDWSAPLVEVLSTWRLAHGYGVDPVVRAAFSFNGAATPYLELQVPADPDHPAQTWVMTEAWWAAQVRAPAVDSMTAYMRHVLPRIINGIRAGYEIRERSWTARRDRERATALERIAARDDPPAGTAAASPGAADSGAVTPAAAGATADARSAGAATTAGTSGSTAGTRPGTDPSLVLRELTPTRRWAWIEWLDRIQVELSILAAGPALVLGSFLLLLYAPLRALPIAALRDAAILRSADSKLTDWFGDLPDLLDDPVQAANVRARLAETIEGLRRLGCGRIVLVAHSGGAIVSFTTLLDPAYLDRSVDKLVTLGEGLQLAWRLEDASAGLPKGSRLSGNLAAARPNLVWTDFWATYDPAPAGYLSPPPAAGVTVNVDPRPVTNRMSILDDHGSYWDNDEGFLLPLLREIDTPTGAADGSRFFTDSALRAVRIERRRRRVAVLALWRWIASVGAVVPIVLATLTGIAGLPGLPGPDRLGRDAAAFWGRVPGKDLVAGPLDWIASWAAWPSWLRPLGEWALGVVLIVVLFRLVAGVGSGRWNAWDLRERLAARQPVLLPLSRQGPLVEFALLTILTVLVAALVLAWLWRPA